MAVVSRQEWYNNGLAASQDDAKDGVCQGNCQDLQWVTVGYGLLNQPTAMASSHPNSSTGDFSGM